MFKILILWTLHYCFSRSWLWWTCNTCTAFERILFLSAAILLYGKENDEIDHTYLFQIYVLDWKHFLGHLFHYLRHISRHRCIFHIILKHYTRYYGIVRDSKKHRYLDSLWRSYHHLFPLLWHIQLHFQYFSETLWLLSWDEWKWKSWRYLKKRRRVVEDGNQCV